VKSLLPDRTVLGAGRIYIDTIHSICELILNPLWGRVEKVLCFLPADARSVRSRAHYQDCMRWLEGVSSRIERFLTEQKNGNVCGEFDIGKEIEDFTRDVVCGYVREKGGARVELRLERLDPAVIRGNLSRFQRMYLNLIMNAVDAVAAKSGAALNVSDVVEGERVVLRVQDNGTGMSPEKIEQLMTDKETLDGELDSLGFVFVRQIIGEFMGELSIDSELGGGTAVTVSFPCLQGRKGDSPVSSIHVEFEIVPYTDSARLGVRAVGTGEDLDNARVIKRTNESVASGAVEVQATSASVDDHKGIDCGRLIYRDYQISKAQFPGCLFAVSVAEDNRVDFFAHTPYDQYWDTTHEELSPMLCEATVRGRLEEDEQKVPVLTLKAPQNVREYFEFKEVPEERRSAEKHVQMVHDEYIRIARKFIETGLPPNTGVYLSDLQKFFPGQEELWEQEPLALELLALQELTSEGKG
jgi:Histidine kinase-, DNA gyrase B-, and HSP90-like ATPase